VKMSRKQGGGSELVQRKSLRLASSSPPPAPSRRETPGQRPAPPNKRRLGEEAKAVTTVYPLLPELQLLLTTRTGAALRAFLKAASKVAVGRFLIFFATLYLGLGGKKSLSEDVGKVFALHLLATVCGHLVFTYRGKAFDDAGFLLSCFLASLASHLEGKRALQSSSSTASRPSLPFVRQRRQSPSP